MIKNVIAGLINDSSVLTKNDAIRLQKVALFIERFQHTAKTQEGIVELLTAYPDVRATTSSLLAVYQQKLDTARDSYNIYIASKQISARKSLANSSQSKVKGTIKQIEYMILQHPDTQEYVERIRKTTEAVSIISSLKETIEALSYGLKDLVSIITKNS